MDALESPGVQPEVLRDECNFIQNVSQFYNQESLSDVTLKVGDQRYYGHRFVLAKSSDVFRTMLYEKPWVQEASGECDLSESPECQAVFDKFLRYLYTAEISINSSSAVGILCLADKYNVASLKALCTKYMVENCRSPKVRNALCWYSWAKALHLESLIRQCTQTIAWNAQEIINSSDWLNMDVDFLCDMLQSSDLVVREEFSLLEAVTRWLLDESHASELSKVAPSILGLIRFPQIQAAQLFQVEQSELATQAETCESVHQLLGRAYRFRALCPTQGELGLSFNEPFYMPRNYSSLTVDIVRMQNSLRFINQVDVHMYIGAIPQENRDGDWKLAYRKNGDTWAIQIYCHDSGMVNNEARFQTSIVVYDEEDKVIQVDQAPTFVCTRGCPLNHAVTMRDPEASKNLAVLIKPVPS